MRSRASGAACLDASFGASADALRPMWAKRPALLRENRAKRDALPFLDLLRRIARERVPTIGCSAGSPPATASPSQIVNLVYRLAYNADVAAGQLAVFQGASDVPISGSIRVERATRKNSQLAAARRVALKMGRRLRCSSVTYRFRYAPSSRLADGPF